MITTQSQPARRPHRRRFPLRSGTALLPALCLLAGAASAQSGFDATGFSITLGDEVIAGAPPPARSAAAADAALRRADVQVRFDGLDRTRLLNVATGDLRTAYPAGAPVTFRTSANYPLYIDRAEIRILDRSGPGARLLAALPAAPNGTVDWTMPAGGDGSLAYVLRVYDRAGRYDETAPLPLARSAAPTAPAAAAPVAAGEAEDRTARRGIPVRGGTITVSGTNAPAGGTVSVMGEAVPVDGAGRFVVSRIVPPGDRVVDVEVGGRTLRRDVTIPETDWFGVGLVDITAGLTRGGIDGGEDGYVNGRLAYYLSGRTAGGWQVTSQADTGDGPIADAFSRLNDKDPRRVLDRLRADGGDLYPTYGDDSRIEDDAPSSGNVYLRLENETTRILWGDFDAGIAGPGLLNNTRDLYGLELAYRSAGVTARGEPRLAATVHAAQPETLAQRDILRGTGGSVYFLSRQDITGGSTAVTVQLADPETGYVAETRVLREGQDYRVDHLQGVLILAEPLASSASDGGLFDSAGGDYEVRLVAQYEYTPTETAISDSAVGGRVEGWITDDLRLGLTVMREETGAGTQDMAGVDLRYVLGANSHVGVEVARTEGPGFARALSTDGGLTITSSGGAVAAEAQAVALDAVLDFGDLGLGRPGRLGLYYDRKDAGFSTLAEDIEAGQELIGLTAEVAATDRLEFGLAAERFTRAGGEERTEAEVSLAYALTDRMTVSGGLALLDSTVPGDPDDTGRRLDAALRLAYDIDDATTVYGFVQGTLDRDGGLSDNNRAGIGGRTVLGDRLTLSGEVSDGDGGVAAQARLSYRPGADNEIYIGYALDPTRAGAESGLDDRGRLVISGSRRHSDRLSTFAETVLDRPGDGDSLTTAYGVTYTPDPDWVLSGGFETGTIRGAADGDFDRVALSFGAAWSPDEDLSARIRVEYRSEDGDGTARDRETWAVTAGYANQVSDDWRLIAGLDALYSDSAEGDFRDGEYLRASVGYAYRPLDNERLNMLFRYTHLRDLPGEDQVDANGDDEGPLQRSHVVSAAVSYDLFQELTLGAKLGYRMSEVAERGTEDFTSNTATLLALRLDWHMPHQWDVMAEGRALATRETDTLETGAVLAVYRHLGPNAKVGLGYEWGSVSDDETDIDYDSQGLFLNIVGKF